MKAVKEKESSGSKGLIILIGVIVGLIVVVAVFTATVYAAGTKISSFEIRIDGNKYVIGQKYDKTFTDDEDVLYAEIGLDHSSETEVILDDNNKVVQIWCDDGEGVKITAEKSGSSDKLVIGESKADDIEKALAKITSEIKDDDYHGYYIYCVDGWIYLSVNNDTNVIENIKFTKSTGLFDSIESVYFYLFGK